MKANHHNQTYYAGDYVAQAQILKSYYSQKKKLAKEIQSDQLWHEIDAEEYNSMLALRKRVRKFLGNDRRY